MSVLRMPICILPSLSVVVEDMCAPAVATALNQCVFSPLLPPKRLQHGRKTAAKQPLSNVKSGGGWPRSSVIHWTNE